MAAGRSERVNATDSGVVDQWNCLSRTSLGTLVLMGSGHCTLTDALQKMSNDIVKQSRCSVSHVLASHCAPSAIARGAAMVVFEEFPNMLLGGSQGR